eukprot:gb/GECG01006567.1/.p1 GENE.gb/GECG01006567.1/~~gb/GECG01006567.1/.p1  ORF type:complete len:492 (+),score=77.67 gb/GECG01006567.1/:1-1476(+)
MTLARERMAFILNNPPEEWDMVKYNSYLAKARKKNRPRIVNLEMINPDAQVPDGSEEPDEFELLTDPEHMIEEECDVTGPEVPELECFTPEVAVEVQGDIADDFVPNASAKTEEVIVIDDDDDTEETLPIGDAGNAPDAPRRNSSGVLTEHPQSWEEPEDEDSAPIEDHTPPQGQASVADEFPSQQFFSDLRESSNSLETSTSAYRKFLLNLAESVPTSDKDNILRNNSAYTDCVTKIEEIQDAHNKQRFWNLLHASLKEVQAQLEGSAIASSSSVPSIDEKVARYRVPHRFKTPGESPISGHFPSNAPPVRKKRVWEVGRPRKTGSRAASTSSSLPEVGSIDNVCFHSNEIVCVIPGRAADSFWLASVQEPVFGSSSDVFHDTVSCRWMEAQEDGRFREDACVNLDAACIVCQVNATQVNPSNFTQDRIFKLQDTEQDRLTKLVQASRAASRGAEMGCSEETPRKVARINVDREGKRPSTKFTSPVIRRK